MSIGNKDFSGTEEENNSLSSLLSPLSSTSLSSVLDSLISDPLLRNVLVGTLPLYAAEAGKTPFSLHAQLMDFYNQSAFRVVGGSGTIAQALRNEIERLGGRVLTRQEVTHVECNSERATGVKTRSGEAFEADYIVADIHPARLLELVDSPLLRPAYRRRVASIRNTIGAFSVYLHFKPGQMPYMNHNFYSYREASPWNCEHYTAASWPMGYLYMHFAQQVNQAFAESGVILSYMRFDEVEPWKGTQVGRRGADYETFKRERAERLIAAVERDHPGFAQTIEHYYTSTPLTWLDYTGTQDGSMYGVAKDITVGPAARVPHRTKIPNLLLTGQNINSHGAMGVTVGTIVTCGELIGADVLFNDMRKCNQ